MRLGGILFATGFTRGYQYAIPTGLENVLIDCFPERPGQAVPRNDDEGEKLFA